MRIILVATAIAAATFVDTRASRATEGPWCATSRIDADSLVENCSMQSFEMCLQEVIAGNRGFCDPNPRWRGSWPGAERLGAPRKRTRY